MLQMVGVIILALGLPTFFASLHHGHVDNTTMVLGYVVMRVAMLIQWGRVYLQAPHGGRVALWYIGSLLISQVIWVALALAHTTLTVFVIVAIPTLLIELSGPIFGERSRRREGVEMATPWHPHHIAERYSLLAIIALGEGVVGTVAALSGAVQEAGGWTLQAVLVVIAGVGLTFGMWWTYFGIDWASALHANPARGFGWGYGHILLYIGIAGTGAGLHVAGYVIEGKAEHLSNTEAVLTVAGPVLLFVVMLIVLYSLLLRTADAFHLLLLGLSIAVLAAGVALAAAGVSMGWSLIVVMLAPVVLVVGYETIGHRHVAADLASLHD